MRVLLITVLFSACVTIPVHLPSNLPSVQDAPYPASSPEFPSTPDVMPYVEQPCCEVYLNEKN